MDVDTATNRFMDSLLFRHLKGDTSPSEEEVVLQWRGAAEENEVYFQGLARILELSALAGRDEVETGEPPSGAELIAIAEMRGGPRRAHGRAGRSLGLWSAMSLAGSLGALATAVLMLAIGGSGSATQEGQLAFGVNEFVTGATEPATVHLRDGTLVRLAPQSRLRLTGTAGTREVTLDGRAFFAVAKVPGKPFTVKSQGGEAVVLGTRFEAEAHGDEMRLLVVEGSVALGPVGGKVKLEAGEMARSVEGAVSTPVVVEEVPEMIAWVGDFLVFQDTPVRQVAVEMERHFGMSIDVRGAALDEHTVTAWFGDSSQEEVMRVVCKVLAARCSLDGEDAVIDLTGTNVSRRASS